MASSTWNKTKSKKKYLVTALVPSETACLASSPGRRSLTAVTWQQNAFGIFRYIKSRAHVNSFSSSRSVFFGNEAHETKSPPVKCRLLSGSSSLVSSPSMPSPREPKLSPSTCYCFFVLFQLENAIKSVLLLHLISR